MPAQGRAMLAWHVRLMPSSAHMHPANHAPEMPG